MSEPIQYGVPVERYGADVRTRFMVRVYGHLVAAILAFVVLEVVFFASGFAERFAEFVFGTSWLLILGGFMIVSWLSTSVAARARSAAAQYTVFAALIAAEALIFVPMLWIAAEAAPSGTIANAAWISIVAFIGLSGVAITSGRDFSFLGSLLKWGGIVALVMIVAAVLMGVNLGMWFSVAMIAIAGGAILYDTQVILRSYPPDREIAAAMSLFASLALLFWYVLRLLSRR